MIPTWMFTKGIENIHDARRCGVVRLSFRDRTGSKLRPAVVVQADSLNQSIDDTSLALVTRTRRGGLTELPIDVATSDGKQTGLFHSSVVDCKNLLTSDQKFIYTKLGSLSTSLLQQLDDCLKNALGLK
jgi:mRNA-degrading endonuclease toxin of MazEF toxin-antitoxin module